MTRSSVRFRQAAPTPRGPETPGRLPSLAAIARHRRRPGAGAAVRTVPVRVPVLGPVATAVASVARAVEGGVDHGTPQPADDEGGQGGGDERARAEPPGTTVSTTEAAEPLAETSALRGHIDVGGWSLPGLGAASGPDGLGRVVLVLAHGADRVPGVCERAVTGPCVGDEPRVSAVERVHSLRTAERGRMRS